MRKIHRRDFLKAGRRLAAASALTACGGSAARPALLPAAAPLLPAALPGPAPCPPLIPSNWARSIRTFKADIKILTNRTDIVDTTYAGYAEQFHELYPNITVTYEALTDYEESLTLRLMTGEWGDICFIPLGDFDTLDPIYNFISDKTYGGKVYGIANGGNADGVAYNNRIWPRPASPKRPATPDEFLDDQQIIKDKTDAIPLYTNFAAGWDHGRLGRLHLRLRHRRP